MVSNYDSYKTQLQWSKDILRIEPSEYFFSMAGAHYFNASELPTTSSTPTVDNVFDALKNSSDTRVSRTAQLAKTAREKWVKGNGL
jgi:hypothetical protein